jgi:hypothetical protein
MKVKEIAEAIAKLPPDQLARFRRWFTAFEAGRTDHADELDAAATKLGRLAGRAFAELKKRANPRKEGSLHSARRVFLSSAMNESMAFCCVTNGSLMAASMMLLRA